MTGARGGGLVFEIRCAAATGFRTPRGELNELFGEIPVGRAENELFEDFGVIGLDVIEVLPMVRFINELVSIITRVGSFVF